jgi:deoxyribodipyrimidine photo-lyase
MNLCEAEPRFEKVAHKFFSELVWREFSYGLLHQKPTLHSKNYRPQFDAFAWQDNSVDFKKWTKGETGYDLVDAGMKELWQTGTMHNRVRMIAASFLIKHLMIDWRKGEEWFWDCLLDADPANNPASWQWVAGSGADAAPYFRIFNPITAAQKFDPNGKYQSQFLDRPQYNDLFSNTNLRPAMMVDHAFARQRALDAYHSIGNAHDLPH